MPCESIIVKKGPRPPLFEGYVDVLDYLIARGMEHAWRPLPTFAARGGRLDTLRWLVEERGFRVDYDVVTAAAANGDVDTLNYVWDRAPVQSRGFFFHHVCREAARAGHLLALQWAQSRGCFWNCETLVAAAMERHHDAFVFARNHGCPRRGIGSAVMDMVGEDNRKKRMRVKWWMFRRGIRSFALDVVPVPRRMKKPFWYWCVATLYCQMLNGAP